MANPKLTHFNVSCFSDGFCVKAIDSGLSCVCFCVSLCVCVYVGG